MSDIKNQELNSADYEYLNAFLQQEDGGGGKDQANNTVLRGTLIKKPKRVAPGVVRKLLEMGLIEPARIDYDTVPTRLTALGKKLLGIPFPDAETTVQAIETIYQGCKFRSRTEARWAVFFTALGIKWVYEPEGFKIGNIRYLPDFLLFPPKNPGGGDFAKAHTFAQASRITMLLCEGPPGVDSQILLSWNATDGTTAKSVYVVLKRDGSTDFIPADIAMSEDERANYLAGVNASRQERFDRE